MKVCWHCRPEATEQIGARLWSLGAQYGLSSPFWCMKPVRFLDSKASLLTKLMKNNDDHFPFIAIFSCLDMCARQRKFEFRVVFLLHRMPNKARTISLPYDFIHSSKNIDSWSSKSIRAKVNAAYLGQNLNPVCQIHIYGPGYFYPTSTFAFFTFYLRLFPPCSICKEEILSTHLYLMMFPERYRQVSTFIYPPNPHHSLSTLHSYIHITHLTQYRPVLSGTWGLYWVNIR